MQVLFYEAADSTWRTFQDELEIIEANRSEDIPRLLKTAEKRSAEGQYAALWMAYEAAPAFDPLYRTKPADRTMPLMRIGFFKRETILTGAFFEDAGRGDCAASAFIPAMNQADYEANVAKARAALEAGDSYQINLTFPLFARFSGEPFAWFAKRIRELPGNYSLFFGDEDFSIASFSPELFFTREKKENGSNLLRCKPMKGTLKREAGKEAEQKAFLQGDEKNRAENLMIADMIRNDLGKIADPGSVVVPELYGVEFWPTVVQMTSTVEAFSQASLAETFAALYPCASITGAPKIKSMEIIASLENHDRGVYTGTLGILRPDGSSRFSVAIRTAVFDHSNKNVRYGTGSGIVWGSQAPDERRECLTKTAVLDSDDGFYVFDSMPLKDGRIVHLDRHLARLRKSCRYFYLPESTHAGLETELSVLCRNRGDGSWKVRILCRADGTRSIECDPVPPLPDPYRVAPAPGRLAVDNPFFAHKTSRREHLDNALQEARLVYGENVSDAVLVNSRGELTETTRANIVLEIDGTRYTPPLDSGILPGVFRSALLEAGTVHEKILYLDDWHRADRAWAVNSVRGWIEAERIPQDYRASRVGDSGPSCPF